MKTCVICKESKDSTDFNKNNSKKDGLQNICRVCSKEKSKAYYADAPAKHRQDMYAKNKKRKAKSKRLMLSYLSDKCCVECGNSDIRVLEFDHLKDKKRNICALVAEGYGWETIIAEIAKCEIVCANCHRIRSSIRGNWYKHTHSCPS